MDESAPFSRYRKIRLSNEYPTKSLILTNQLGLITMTLEGIRLHSWQQFLHTPDNKHDRSIDCMFKLRFVDSLRNSLPISGDYCGLEVEVKVLFGRCQRIESSQDRVVRV